MFLVDGDNHINTGLQGIEMLSPEDTVLIFYGKGQTIPNLQKLCAQTQAKVQFLESVKSGRNAIDFQIIVELGILVGRGEADFIYIISQDKGYEAAVSVLYARYAHTFREVALRSSIEDCARAAFLLRTSSKKELAKAMLQQYGLFQGALAYDHLSELFSPEIQTPPAPPVSSLSMLPKKFIVQTKASGKTVQKAGTRTNAIKQIKSRKKNPSFPLIPEVEEVQPKAIAKSPG